MAFTTSIATIPANTTAGRGKGLTVSLLKALVHASVIRAADENEYLAMGEDGRKAEITEIVAHLNDENLIAPPFASTEFGNMIANLRTIGADLEAEAGAWDETTTRTNLGMLNDRVLTILRAIDTELAGITGAEAGDQL